MNENWPYIKENIKVEIRNYQIHWKKLESQ